MKPVIGILLRYNKLEDDRPILYIPEALRRCIQKAGGFIYPICPVQDVDYINTRSRDFLELTQEEKEDISRSLDFCDGVLFPGGTKFTPYDRYVLEEVIKRDIPVLGICLGMQLMSCFKRDVVLGSIEGVNHFQEDDLELTHKVKLDNKSKLYEIIGQEEFMVNSFHKKHVLENEFYKIVGYSSDGLIEAIEYLDNTFNIGVQWHPEISYSFDEKSKKLIDSFIKETLNYRMKNRH